MNKLSRNILFVATTAAMSAQAGTVLRLNSGRVETRSAEQLMSAPVSVVQSAQDLIIQFKNRVTEADKASLIKAGGEVFGYLPDDALMVRMSAAKVQDYRNSHGNVEAVLAWRPEYKISNFFTASSVFNRNEQQVIVVKNFKASETNDIALRIQKLPQAAILNADGKSIVASVPRAQIRNVAALQGVEHVQPYTEMKPMHMVFDENASDDTGSQAAGDYSDITGDEPGTKVMNFQPAWDMGYHGQNQIASMADTGLDGGEGAISADFQGAVSKGYFFGLFSKSWDDPMGHGTHVAGSVVGRGTASGGKIHGGAYEAQFIPEGMWSPMLKNLSVPSKLQDLFSKAYGDGARIHTNSWGAARNFGAYDTFANNVDEFMFNNPDMLILFAAGNSGVDMDKDGRIDPGSVSSPGTAKNAMTVGASENVVDHGGIQVPISALRSGKDFWSAEPIYSSKLSDNANGLAMFSSRGPTTDGRTKPDIVAPGTNILSNRSHVPGAEVLWGAYNADYAYSGGTSMATPLTAGAATVTRQVLQEKFQQASPSAALVKATMLHTAVDMFPGQYGEVGAAHGQELITHRPNSDEGYGRVNVGAVAQLNGSATHFVDSKDGVGQGETATVQVTLKSPGKLMANLVYTDAPASPDAAVALVNDLDLAVTTPSGAVISPNDHINNTEVVEQDNMPAGTYTITVRGNNVPQGKNGKQPYALVYTAREN